MARGTKGHAIQFSSMSYLSSRWDYFKQCGEHARKHRGAAVVSITFAAYALVSNLAPFVELPTFVLPKIPLPWAAVVVLMVVLFMLIEGGYRLRNADRQEAERRLDEKLAELQSTIVGKDEELQRAKSSPTSADWKELAGEFEKSSDFVRADWQCNRKNNVTTYNLWSFAGGVETKACETLCRYAGTMLLKSPHVSDAKRKRARTIRPSVAMALFSKGKLRCFAHALPSSNRGGRNDISIREHF